MYLCNCKGIRNAHLLAFLDQEQREKGYVDKVKALGKFSLTSGLGTGCGKCVKDAHQVIKDHASKDDKIAI